MILSFSQREIFPSFAFGEVLSFPKERGVPRPGAGCLRRVTFFPWRKKVTKERHLRKGGFRFPPERALRVRLTIFAKQKSIFRLNAKETPDGFLSHYLPFRRLSVCACLPLWKHPPGLGDYQIAPLPRSGKGRWRPRAAGRNKKENGFPRRFAPRSKYPWGAPRNDRFFDRLTKPTAPKRGR